MNSQTFSTSKTADIGSLLDDGPFTLIQKLIVCLAALSIIMDGFDGQLIGYAIPTIIKEWGITRNAFAPAVAAGLAGMGIGSACAGLFADRFGRWAAATTTRCSRRTGGRGRRPESVRWSPHRPG